MTELSLEQLMFLKCSPQTSKISITWGLVRNAIRPHPRTNEPTALRDWGQQSVFLQTLKAMLMHPYIWELLYNRLRTAAHFRNTHKTSLEETTPSEVSKLIQIIRKNTSDQLWIPIISHVSINSIFTLLFNYKHFLENWLTHSFFPIFHNTIKTLKVGSHIVSSFIHIHPSLMGEGVVEEIQKFSKTFSDIFWGEMWHNLFLWIMQY